jgi:hypothetical protein
MYICGHIYIYIYIYMYIHRCLYIYIDINTYIYKYTFICIGKLSFTVEFKIKKQLMLKSVGLCTRIKDRYSANKEHILRLSDLQKGEYI